MIDIVAGLAFVAMILSPAIVATVQRARNPESDNN